jgi:hypothetical protein
MRKSELSFAKQPFMLHIFAARADRRGALA